MKKLFLLFLALAAGHAQAEKALPECGTDDYVKGYKTRKPGAVPGEDKEEPGVQKAAWFGFSLIPEAMAADVSVEDRIKDCAKVPGSKKISTPNKTNPKGVEWNLVSRRRDPESGRLMEVWRDSKSGLLWGDALNSKYKHYDAIALDSRSNVVSETACKSDEGKAANAQLGEKAFGLPTREEFEGAEKNGVREVVPNMIDRIAGPWFWSASVHPAYSDRAFCFSGHLGVVDHYDNRDFTFVSVRCVGR